MKKMATIFLTLSTAVFAVAADTTNVTATIKGRPLEFSSDIRARVVQKATDLLASCAYMEKSQNGALADTLKGSHLRLVFSRPCKVEVSIEKVTVEVKEMVISLPLVTAGIWVRTKDGITYFSKFGHTTYDNLQRLLDEAQKREIGA